MDGWHNRVERLRLVAFRVESTGVDGDLLTPGAGRLDKSGGRGRKQGGTAGGDPLVLAAGPCRSTSQLQRGGRYQWPATPSRSPTDCTTRSRSDGTRSTWRTYAPRR